MITVFSDVGEFVWERHLRLKVVDEPGEKRELRARREIDRDSEQNEAKRIEDAVNEQDPAQDDESGKQDQAAIDEELRSLAHRGRINRTCPRPVRSGGHR
jgi:hypothetical protein